MTRRNHSGSQQRIALFFSELDPPDGDSDKAKVDNRVRFAQGAILGSLGGQIFFSLVEANAVISEAVDRINDHVICGLAVPRCHLFKTFERPALVALAEDCQLA